MCIVVNGGFLQVCCATCLRKAEYVRNSRMFLKVQQAQGREVHGFFLKYSKYKAEKYTFCNMYIHIYYTYIAYTFAC